MPTWIFLPTIMINRCWRRFNPSRCACCHASTGLFFQELKWTKLILDGVEYEFPVVTGSEGEKAIDIWTLRSQTGHIPLDPGFGNTGS